MEMKRYCPACGSELDADGICTKKTCPRRKIQLRVKKAQEATKPTNGQ